MIIQCKQCKTKFKLDDARVKGKKVKVRCARCRNVFSVSIEQQLAEKPDFSGMVEPSADISTVSASPTALKLEQKSGSASAVGFDLDTSSFAVDDHIEKPVSAKPVSFEIEKDEAAQGTASSEDFDISSLAFNDGIATPADASITDGGNIDFSGIAADRLTVEAKPDLDDFVGSIESHGLSGSHQSADGKPDEPFNLGDIDFGDSLETMPGHQINPEKLDDDTDLLFVPLDADQHEKKESKSFTAMKEPDQTHPHLKKYDDYENNISMLNPLTLEQLDEEMQEKEQQPPLSIASRRKSSSMLVIVMSVVCAAIVALLLFFGLDKSSEDKAKPQQEAAGRIELRAVNAYFVKNSTAGELLVISGEAVNSFEAPRASIQVKGIVYGDANKVLISKNAYAGNPLSREQLAAMPLDKIETTMSNQFGDSLANMGVAPGKGIPFVVIIPQVPADAREYGLELVGSTGADPKK